MSDPAAALLSPVAPAAPGARERPAHAELDEHDLYPVHEEDDVPEKPLHERQVRYLTDALSAHLPEKWVTGNICMYWEERNFHRYLGPDVLVVDCPPPNPPPDVHLKWTDAPALLVIEIGSKSTFLRDEGPKVDIYGLDLRVPEYLYYHPTRHDFRFFRLANGGYMSVMPDARGWVHSDTLDVWFGADESGFVRVHTAAGEALPSHEEAVQARAQAEARIAELAAELARLKVGESG